MTCTNINRHPGSPTALEAQQSQLPNYLPLSSLSFPLVPKHCIPRLPKPVHIAHLAPINHTPESLQILLLAPHAQASAHPRMLVDTEAHERAEVVAGATEELGRAELFVGVRPTTDEVAGCRGPPRYWRRFWAVEVCLLVSPCAWAVLRRRGQEVARGRGRGAVLL